MATHQRSSTNWSTVTGSKVVTLTGGGAGIPQLGELLVAWLAYTDGTLGGGTITDNNTGGTYTRVLTGTWGSSNQHTFSGWIRDNLISFVAGTLVTMTPEGSDTGGGLAVSCWSGFTEAAGGALRQINTNRTNNSAGTPAATMSVAIDTASACMGLVLNASVPSGIVEPASWNERSDFSYTTPSSGIEAVTRDSGETGSTITWGGASATNFSVGLMELAETQVFVKTGSGLIGP